MGKNSKIAWTDHSFNPWWGCTRVSAGCQNCYAERQASRFQDVWGVDKPRRFFSERHWNDPRRWNRQAERTRTRARVFCGSMCDVFENRADLDSSRIKLWELIGHTKSLDWLLLTKRPENVEMMLPAMWRDRLPSNVWMGATVENQEAADVRIPQILQIPALVHFISVEPMLERIIVDRLRPVPCLDWVIVGAESGPKARPMNEDWVRDLRDQCAGECAFFYKQRIENGKKVLMPELDGRVWNQYPEEAT